MRYRPGKARRGRTPLDADGYRTAHNVFSVIFSDHNLGQRFADSAGTCNQVCQNSSHV